ncbi:thioredoxin-like protein [Pilaira anomala]|nr:thioredoxin-like protein [Pilaira anomala]
MSTSLPFTVQDDIEAKEKYASTQQKGSGSRSCSSRRLRIWFLLILASLTTLGLVTYFGNSNFINSSLVGAVEVDNMIINEEPISLKKEIEQLIKENDLIVFSKTYCPYSLKAKRILGTYQFSSPLKVIEVDLRDDDYQVKMVLKEISARDTFPNIFLLGKTLGGSDDLELLHETGKLKKLLKDLTI